MEIIVGSLLALFAIAALVILVVVNRKKAKLRTEKEEPSTPASDCCGAHEVCELDEIKMDVNRIDYYEDEELDRLANTDPNTYTDNQIDELREVLYTLKPNEIRYWLVSIERRKIELPSILQEEARMLMAEA